MLLTGRTHYVISLNDWQKYLVFGNFGQSRSKQVYMYFIDHLFHCHVIAWTNLADDDDSFFTSFGSEWFWSQTLTEVGQNLVQVLIYSLQGISLESSIFRLSFMIAGCYKITTVFSHAQTVVLCVGCSTVLCQPTGGKARLTEGKSPSGRVRTAGKRGVTGIYLWHDSEGDVKIYSTMEKCDLREQHFSRVNKSFYLPNHQAINCLFDHTRCKLNSIPKFGVTYTSFLIQNSI